MTIQDLLTEGTRLLKSPCPNSCIDTPSLDAALLLAETLQKTRTELFVQGNEHIEETNKRKFFDLIERRINGECVAYILGRREFRGLEFSVNPHVLVPRPETETLVEAALEYIDARKNTETPSDSQSSDYRNISLLDLCTGSGALAISLKNERPLLSVSASDISPQALETAKLNAENLLYTGCQNNENSIKFIQCSLFENITDTYDIIVSNPPYIPSNAIDALQPEVRKEPLLALDGGKDGMELIKKIISQTPLHLHKGGILLLEADPGQMTAIKTLLANNYFTAITAHRDLSGKDRVISASIAE